MKVVLGIFCDSQGISHREYVPSGQKVNKEYYVEIIYCSVQRTRLVRPQFQDRGSWLNLHDVRPCSIKKEVSPPPNSSDLSSPDLFFFPKIKSTLKDRRFEDTEDFKRIVAKELLALHANEFKPCFQQFYETEFR
jgi:hypothetical protein